jgi:hypothetical protein
MDYEYGKSCSAFIPVCQLLKGGVPMVELGVPEY